MRELSSGPVIAAALAAVATTFPSAIHADDFYAGKSITISTYGAPGDSYDVYMRLLSRHYGRHIPGNPRFTAIHQPGAGGILPINHAAMLTARMPPAPGCI